MSRLLNPFKTGRPTLLPSADYPTIQPGMATLSPAEVRDLSLRICQDYEAVSRNGGVPSADKLMENLAWYVLAVTLETEAIVRERDGETEAAALLQDVADLVIELEDADIDAVEMTTHLLSTGAVLTDLSDDLRRCLFGQRLALSYLDRDDTVRCVDLPKGGFSCAMT